MFQGFEHVAIASANPKALAEWYVNMLGFRHIFEYLGNQFVKASNGTILEIIPSKGERAPQQLTDPGIRHLAIQVSDFDAGMEHLKGLGVQFIGEPIHKEGNRLAFFTDSEGNFLHLIHREKPLPQ